MKYRILRSSAYNECPYEGAIQETVDEIKIWTIEIYDS